MAKCKKYVFLSSWLSYTLLSLVHTLFVAEWMFTPSKSLLLPTQVNAVLRHTIVRFKSGHKKIDNQLNPELIAQLEYRFAQNKFYSPKVLKIQLKLPLQAVKFCLWREYEPGFKQSVFDHIHYCLFLINKYRVFAFRIVNKVTLPDDHIYFIMHNPWAIIVLSVAKGL